MMNIYSIRKIEPSKNGEKVKMTMGNSYHCSEGLLYITDQYLNGGTVGSDVEAYMNELNNCEPQTAELAGAYTEIVFPLLPARKYFLGDLDTDEAEKFAQRITKAFNTTAKATKGTNNLHSPDENFFHK